METKLFSQHISTVANAKVVVLFGGNPYRRDEIIKLLMKIASINIYGALSEEDGMNKLKDLKKVDLVLIGGMYSDEQRVRIRSFVSTNMPSAKTTEPGYDYPYDNREILNQVREKLCL